MKLDNFAKTMGHLPVIETSNLLLGAKDPNSLHVQISRWEKGGKLIQLKRGIYILADPYRKIDIYPAYIAATLKRPSYISLEKALEYHDLIPEVVPVYTCVTTKRPSKFENILGVFEYQHIQVPLFWGYESIVVNQQMAFMATPEKALLDLVYLRAVKISMGYFTELRLQNTEKLNLAKLHQYAKKFNKPKILKASRLIQELVEATQKEEKIL